MYQIINTISQAYQQVDGQHLVTGSSGLEEAILHWSGKILWIASHCSYTK